MNKLLKQSRLFFLSFSIVLFLGFFSQLTYVESEIKSFNNNDFSHYDSKNISSPGIVIWNKNLLLSKINTLKLSFNFISNDPTFSYGNLFQTGNSIDAFRMEVQPNNKLVAVLPGGSVIEVSNSIEIGKKYNLNIQYETSKFLKIYLDDKEAVNLNDLTLTRRIMDYSKIVLGSGLQQQRNFSGVISEFEIKGTERNISNFSLTLLIVSALIILFLLANFIYHERLIIKKLSNYLLKKLFLIRSFELLKKLNKDNKIILSSAFISIGLFLSLIFNYIKTIFYPLLKNPEELKPPIYSIFHQPINIFCDFFSQFDSFVRFGPWDSLLYFPASNLLVGFFASISRGNPYRGIAISSLLSFIILTILIYEHFKNFHNKKILLNVFFIFFMSYPLLFTYHTGNMEIWVFIFLLNFFLFYYSTYKTISIFFLAAAISIKLYPIVFIFILLRDKQFSLIMKTVFWIILLTLLPFLIWPTSFDYYFQGLKSGMNAYNELMVKNTAGIHFGHSLLNSYRTFFHNINVENLFPAYYIFMISSFLILTSYALFYERLIWKRILILVIGLCLLPPTSTDYKLLLFFIPFIYFCATDKSSTYDVVYTLLFSFIFMNKAYIIFNNDQYTTLNGVFNTFIMLLMLVLILFERQINRKLL